MSQDKDYDAPKERINIVYRPATGNVEEDVELPLKLLVLGDFVNRDDHTRLENREPVNIDKDNFNEVLKSQDIKLENLSVRNTFSDEPEDELTISLDFQSIKDFSPEAIAKKVPMLKEQLKVRENLIALSSPLSNIPEFRKAIQNLIKDDTKREQLFKELGIKGE